MPIILHRLAYCTAWLRQIVAGWGDLQLVVRALKTALITAYLAAEIDAGVGYLLRKCSTQYSVLSTQKRRRHSAAASIYR